MSFAGAWQTIDSDVSVDVASALRRLSYSPGVSPVLVTSQDFVLGVVNDSELAGHEEGESGPLTAFEGSLYNEEELRHELGLPATANRAAVVSAAYLRWGDLFADRMWGEFALALWDRARQRLLLALDAMGRGSLHYSPQGHAVKFSTEIRGLMRWPGVDSRINNAFVASSFAIRSMPEGTMIRGIRQMQNGQLLIWERGKSPRHETYWRPLARPRRPLNNSKDDAEQLRDHLLRAVEVRLPKSGVIASQLSSGFDSSGVTALAAQVLARQNRSLLAYTSVPVHAVNATDVVQNRFGNEWPLASEVAAMYPNVEHIAVPTNAASWWTALDALNDERVTFAGFIRNSLWYYGIYAHAQQRDAVSMFEGQAGNLTTSYDGGFGLFDLRRRGRYAELVRAIADRQRVRKASWRSLVMDICMPSNSVRQFLKRVRRKPQLLFFDTVFLRPEFYTASGLPSPRISPMNAILPGDRTDGAAWRFSILNLMSANGLSGAMKRAFGIRREDPTADRRVVEFCLSLPDEAFAPKGVRRQLYRDAMQNDLPAELLQETQRGLQASDFLEAFAMGLEGFREELDRLDATPAAGEILDLKRMRAALDAFPKDQTADRGKMDFLYNYTFGGAISLGRTVRKLMAGEIP